MQEQRKKAAFHSLGCKVNAYETEVMQQQMEEAGYEIVPFAPGADVYIINTCTVTNIADRKSRQMLHRAKKMNPDAIVVAVGCYAQTAQKDDLADLVIGNNQKSRLPELLKEAAAHEKRHFVTNSTGHKEYEQLTLKTSREHTRAFVKVQDGCNQFCSYCLIPYARGRERSRSVADAVSEARWLSASGTREIVLTGIHLSAYGRDLPGGEDLLRLVTEIAAVPGIERIRLGSLDPGILTGDFVRGLAAVPQVCPHFHLSVQSGCDSVLERMHRHYTVEDLYACCQVLRENFDDPALTADVIVGFPGESEQEFAQTKAFLEKTLFYETHVFKYSMRKGTLAARMEGQIPEQVKAERSDELLMLAQTNRRSYEQRHEGKAAELLVEEEIRVKDRLMMVGHTRRYIRAVYAGEGVQAGQVVRVKLKGTPEAWDFDGMLALPHEGD